MKFLIRACVVAALAVPAAATAATHVVIDFDALESNNGQTVPLPGFEEDGFEFSLTFDPPNGNPDDDTGSKGPAIFNTDCGNSCNGDADLKPIAGKGNGNVSGNVLILQQNDGSSPTPNDDADAGSITFKVEAGLQFQLLEFNAVDDGVFKIFVDDTELGEINNGTGSENDGRTGKVALLDSPFLGIGDTFKITYSGSGGVDNIKLGVIPLPATFLLMLTALGGLGFVARRRASSAV